MASATIPVILNFNGGFVTDLPDQARQLSYFLKAENVTYEVTGAIHKVGGTEPLYNSAFGGFPSINGTYDYWYGGGNSSFSQNFILVLSDGTIQRDNLDGSATNITGTASIGTDPIPVFCVARDTLTIWFSTNVAPIKYVGGTSTVSALGGSPPSARGAVFHTNRLFAWGANANPSRLYYSSSASIEDWTGPDTGSIDFDTDNGDRIVGAISFRGNLIVFKGPNKGSIHVLAGTAPTGGDGYRKTPFSSGLPLQTHNSILQVGNDVFFMSNRGIHSLAATQQFGNFTGADESRLLKKFFREQVNQTRLDRVWAADYAQKSIALWTLSQNGSQTNDLVLGFSYVRNEEEGLKPLTWHRSCVSAAIRKNTSSHLDDLVFGTNVGTALKQDTSRRSEALLSDEGFQLDFDALDINSLGGIYSATAYNMRVQTPQLLLGAFDAKGTQRADQPFTLENMYMRSISLGDHDVNVAITRDNNEPELYTFNQGQAGFILDASALDIDRLGGEKMRLVYSDPPVRGEARAIQLDITQGGLDQDAHILEIGFEITPAGQSNVSV